jgi:hypothetical protein
MGFWARLKGVGAPDARVSALREELHRVRNVRLPLYQNDKRIGQVFEQRRSNVTELLAGGGLSLEASGGFPGIVAAKASKTPSATETIQVTPLLQALLLEDTERESEKLVDLSVDGPRPGALLRYVGAGRFFIPGEEVTELPEQELRLGREDAQAIQAARKQQQQTMEAIGQTDTATAVWIGRGSLLLASIASISWLEPSNFRSYMHVPPFGILGIREGKARDAALLAPLLIWHDTAAGEADASRPAAD